MTNALKDGMVLKPLINLKGSMMINDFIEKEAAKYADNQAIQGYLQRIDDQKSALEETYLELIMTILEIKQSSDEKQQFLNQLETASQKQSEQPLNH